MDENKTERRTEEFGDDCGDRDKQESDRNSKHKDKRKSGSTSINSKPDIVLDTWQIDALSHEGNLLLCTGRQVGKTTLMAIKSAEFMVKHPQSQIIVCSLTEDQAQLIIIMTLDYLEKHYKTWIAKGKKAPTKNKIQLNNKSQILARPVGNTGDAVRGFTGDVLILDEVSRFNELIILASKPTLLTTGGQIWMCSTPFGKKGFFYETYMNNKYPRENETPRYKVIETNSWDVIHERPISESWTEEKKKLAIEFIEREKQDMPILQFAQEYLGKFIEDLRQFFSDEWINKVCILKRRHFPVSPLKSYILGVDIARMGNDQSSFEVIDRVNKNVFEHIESMTTTKTLTTETYDRIIQMDALYRFRKIGIDAGSGSLGVGVLDFLMRSPVKSKVVALSNQTRMLDHLGNKKKTLLKEDMYQMMLALGERGVLKLLDDDDVRLSLKSVQYEYTSEEGYNEKVKIFGNYTHIVEGLIRACWLANQKNLNSFISYI